MNRLLFPNGGYMRKPIDSLHVCIALFIVTLPFFLLSCGGKTDPTFNIAGSWYIFHTTNGAVGEQGPDLFAYSQTDNDLSGKVPTGESLTGSVSGLDVSFSWTTSTDSVKKDYSGKISTDGTTMSGTWTDSNNQQGTWNAIIKLDPLGSIQGTWNLTAPTGGVAGVQGFTFVQSGNDLAGSQTLQGEALTGIITNPDIMFFWTTSDGIIYTFIGTTNNISDGTVNDISGTWTDSNGQSGSWSATRS
jgi:hypothetical protein